ncbi:hypothetical protein RCL1_008182 [Eukaryota sp. TZLM3-RCL]
MYCRRSPQSFVLGARDVLKVLKKPVLPVGKVEVRTLIQFSTVVIQSKVRDNKKSLLYCSPFKFNLTIHGDIEKNPGPYSVLGTEWLNNTTITNYFSHLHEQLFLQNENLRNIYYWEPNDVRGWIHGERPEHDCLTKQEDFLLFVPINDSQNVQSLLFSGTHWSLLVIERKGVSTYSYYIDSLVSTPSLPVAKQVVRYLNIESMTTLNSVKQPDS